MKTQIVSMLVLAGMIVGANSALASRARVNVMGQGDNGLILNGSGSFYYDDMYNIFHNPSYANDFKNWVIIEKGPGGTSRPGQQGEGGFVTSFLGVNLGVFLNREDAFTFTRLTGVADTANYGVRPIDVVIAGDHGVKWGVGATYGSQHDDAIAGRQLGLNVGVQVADFAPFVNYRLIGRSRDLASGIETKTNDITGGVKYTYGDWTPYVAYRQVNQKGSATGSDVEVVGRRAWLVGVGRNSKLGENARLVYNINYSRNSNQNNGRQTNIKEAIIPIDLALEADVATWITVRGGLQYRLLDKVTGTTAGAGTQGDSTVARIGATFHVNKVDLDWALGQGTSAGNLDTQTAGFDGGTFTNLSLAYRW